MSQWTHVLAVFHIGGDAADPDMNLLLESIMGPMYAHANFSDQLDNIKVPCGTEGPLQWDITLEPYTAGYYRGVVTVWGNLRDFTDITAVVKWFKTTVTEFREHGLMYGAVCNARICSNQKHQGMALTITDADIKEEGN